MLNTNTMTENITMSIVVIHYYCHFYCRTLLLLPDHHVAFSPLYPHLVSVAIQLSTRNVVSLGLVYCLFQLDC